MIAALEDRYPVAYMCDRLGVTRSKYYAWRQRGGTSTRELEDRRLRTLMRVIHAEWGGIFGYRRMCEILRTQHGEWVGARRVRRLMGEASLWGVPLKKRRHRRTRMATDVVPDLVQRDFAAAAPNTIWVSDLTEIQTAEGKLYLCIIKDLYDGVVVAWHMGLRQTAELVTTTVDRAVASRLDGERPILHSDHGSQYTSEAYRDCLEHHGLTISMGRVRTCADNASAESVFSQLKRELVYRSRFRTRREAIEKIDRYFLKIYNPLRRVSLNKNELEQLAKLDDEERRYKNGFDSLT